MKKVFLGLLFIVPVLGMILYSLFSWSGDNGHPVQRAKAEFNGAAVTPLLGWNSWSSLRTKPTEESFKQQVSAEARSLKSHGYIYANLDDYWYNNPATNVDQYGRWTADTTSFPGGIPALAAYTHSLGLRFGLYVTPGIPVAAVTQNTPIEGTPYHAKDIAITTQYASNYNFNHQPIGQTMYAIDFSKPGAQEFINSWARLFASWGIDYLKLDGVGGATDDLSSIEAWSKGLRFSRRIVYYEVANSLNVSDADTLRQYTNGWRIDGDIEDYSHGLTNTSPLTGWQTSFFGRSGGVVTRFSDVVPWTKYAGFGGWNNLDSLDVGNGASDGLTQDERQSYMTLWSIAAAPLDTGDDLTNLDNYGVSLLTNNEVLAVDQQGIAANPLSTATQQQVWFARERDGSYVVALFNLDSSPATVTVNWSDLGIKQSVIMRDLWSHTDLGKSNSNFSVTLNTHASRLLRIVPVAGWPF